MTLWQKAKQEQARSTFRRNLSFDESVQHEVESSQVCLWSQRRQVPRVHGYTERARSQSRQNQGCHGGVHPKL